jgi:hypothetical protein
MDANNRAVTLWRPVGPAELKLIEESGMRAFPPRLPEQPIFYPVLSEDHAIRIARDWNVPASGAGVCHPLPGARGIHFPLHPAKSRCEAFLEYWIPVGELPLLNAAIIGLIEVVAEFR